KANIEEAARITAAQGPSEGRADHADFYALGPTSVFTVIRSGDDLFGQITGQPRLRLVKAADGTYSYSAATGQISFAPSSDRPPSELTLHVNDHDVRAARIAEMPRTGEANDPALLDQFAGWYQLTPNRVLTVSRNGNGLAVRETGRS